MGGESRPLGQPLIIIACFRKSENVYLFIYITKQLNNFFINGYIASLKTNKTKMFLMLYSHDLFII